MKLFGKSLAAKISLILILPLLLLSLLPASAFADAESEAQAVYDTIHERWLKDKDSLSENLYEPLMSERKPMRSLDESEEGSAQLMCPGSLEALEVQAFPSSTRDLYFISISVDTNLDGTKDYFYIVNGPVSAVCNNGIVKCAPGSFNDCQWFKWVVDPGSGAVTAVSASFDELNNCWCFNSGCARASYSAISDQILNLLGSSLMAAYLNAYPRLTFSDVKIVNPYTIVYTVQNVGQCNFEDPGGMLVYGEVSPERLYDNPAMLTARGQEEFVAQSSDPDSPLYLVQHSPAAGRVGDSTCVKERDVSVVTSMPTPVTIASVSGTGVITETLDPSRFTSFRFSATNVDERGVLCVNDYLIVYTDPASNYVFPEGVVPCSSNPDTSDEHDYNPAPVDVTGYITSTGSARIRVEIRNFHGPSNGVVTFSGDRCMTDYKALPGENLCYKVNENLLDSCSGLETRDECSVKTEKVYDANGNFVYTIQGGIATGNTIPPSCKTLMVGFRTVSVCKDWWRIEREYVCETDEEDGIDLSRAKKIDETLKDAGSNVTFQDIVYDGGGWSSPMPHNFSYSLREYSPQCLPACRVSGYKPPAQTTGMTSTADFRLDPGTRYVSYRVCKDNLCPVKPGETILEDCKCLNTFLEGVVKLEATRQAAIDMICSDGSKAE